MEPTPPPTELPERFSWQAHPAREHLGRAAAGTIAVAALAGGAGALMQSIWWTLLAAAILLVALNRFFFPSTFTIDEEGISARYPLSRRHLNWTDLRLFAHGAEGAFLSSRARPSWLDGRRGLHVRFGSHGKAVLDRIRAHVPEGARSWAR